jgi:disulfide bond formation protein DsbB
MTRKNLIILATAGSAALLIAAFAFQYLGGLAPCKLCLWQRWPHAGAVLLGAVGLAMPSVLIARLGAAAVATSGGLGIYHTGVERGWWEGPTTCTSGSVEGLTPAELMEQILAAPLIRCDEVAWQMFGLSMASWNAIASFALMAIWLWASRLDEA